MTDKKHEARAAHTVREMGAARKAAIVGKDVDEWLVKKSANPVVKKLWPFKEADTPVKNSPEEVDNGGVVEERAEVGNQSGDR